jgi:hypothetical protein
MKAALPALGLLGLLAAVLAGVGVGVGRTREVRVPRPARWDEAMIVCPGAGVDLDALDRAVAWWVDLGHDVEVDCEAPWAVGIDADPSLHTLGLTHVQARGGLVDTAHIRIRPAAWDLVIAHELGHALGYQHARHAPTGHLMHPSRAGWDARGLDDR